MRSVLWRAAAAIGLVLLSGSETRAQTAAAGQAPPRGGGRGGQRGNTPEPVTAPKRAVAMTAISSSVSDLSRSVTFYRTAFGLEVLGSGTPQPSMNAGMVSLVNAGAAKYRQATLQVPHAGGVFLRLMEFSGGARTAAKAGFADPGQVRPRFLVTSMELTLASLKLAGAEIVSSGGQAGASNTPTHVLVRDPDGYVIEIERSENIQSIDGTPVVALHVVLTTADTDKKLAFYNSLLGFAVAPGAWGKMPIGAGEVKRSTSRELGGTNRTLDIAEYRGVGRVTLVSGRVQDPGIGVVSFLVRDLDDILNRVKEAKLQVVTAGGTPVTLARVPRIVVQDPDGAYVEMIQE